MSDHDTARDHYLAAHQRMSGRLPGASDGWLAAERQSALQRFAEAGFPTTRNENWKYTDLRLLVKRGFEPVMDPVGIGSTLLEANLLIKLDCHRLVFVNGHFSETQSAIGTLPRGAILGGTSAAMKQPDAIRELLGRAINGYANAITDLNTAFAIDGLYLDLADGIALDKPVHAIFIGTGSGMHTYRNFLRLGKNSRAVVIEHYVGTEDGQYLTNAVTEVQTSAGSQLSRCKLQQEALQAFHLGSIHAHQQRDTHIRLHGVDLGGRLVRNDTNTKLDGAGAEVHLYGVYAPGGRQHVDNHTRIDHAQAHCTSREVFKGVLDGHSRGVFNGRIVVHKDAQKTDSRQSSAALLLSPNAEVDAKPELEIYADDVKCAHGSTIGQLDEEAVFYLQSRGLNESGARSLLTYSFADETIREVRIEALRRHIEGHFLARLPNGEQFRNLL